ncbi:hypothetical protein OROHE_017679 [Orobanche hederae]
MAAFSSLLLRHKLVYLIHAVAVYLRPLLNFISTNIFRLKINGDGVKEIDFLEAETDLSPEQKDSTEYRNFEEEKPEGMHLTFKFPTYEEFSRIQKGTGNRHNDDDVVPSGCFISAFTDDELEICPVGKEVNVADGISISSNSDEEDFSVGGNLEEVFSQTVGVHERGKDILVPDGEGNEKSEAEVRSSETSGNKARPVGGDDDDGLLKGNNDFFDEYQFSSENNSVITDSDTESASFEHSMSRPVDSHGHGFLSDGDFGGESDNIFNENHESSLPENEFSDEDDDDSDSMEELEHLQVHDIVLQNPDGKNSNFLSDVDFNENPDNAKNADKFLVGDINGKQRSKDSYDDDDSNELESLWEHQELIEQLKVELRKVRATGLPTIFEDSESPKLAVDDLKPWKIDEFQRGDCLGELHKFYKSYRERMRKFDIINYQKMYAMGFLQLKDPLKSISMQKPPPSTLRSLVSQNLWLFKHKIHGTDPMKKFIQEIQGDLEAVYVGQMCLSWEFLNWQYDKALDLWDSDPRGIRRYNEVAGEFQQFQVLLQRFLEDEPFQGPRPKNYVKTRCAVRNLLQVPVIRDDNLKDKRKARAKAADEYVITSDMLVETVEESIRIFWRFVRTDKDCTTANGHKKIPDLPSPEDINLLMEVKRILQKEGKEAQGHFEERKLHNEEVQTVQER